MTPALSPEARRTLLEKRSGANGPAGAAWVERISALAAEMVEAWALRLEPHFDKLSYNYVAPCKRADGTPAVLKLAFVEPEFDSEVAALRAYDGNGAARVLDAEAEKGALLLERLVPGETLTALRDDEAAMRHAASVLRQLWQAPPEGDGLLSLEWWLNDAVEPQRLPEAKRNQPWVAASLEEARDVATSSTRRCLVHGDLHQDNVLSSGHGWCAIDPKGIVGDPCWDLAPLLMNNLAPSGDAWRTTVRRRLDQLCDELLLDRQTAYVLSTARALQSRFWSLRDNAAPGGIMERAYAVAGELAKAP